MASLERTQPDEILIPAEHTNLIHDLVTSMEPVKANLAKLELELGLGKKRLWKAIEDTLSKEDAICLHLFNWHLDGDQTKGFRLEPCSGDKPEPPESVKKLLREIGLPI